MRGGRVGRGVPGTTPGALCKPDLLRAGGGRRKGRAPEGNGDLLQAETMRAALIAYLAIRAALWLYYAGLLVHGTHS